MHTIHTAWTTAKTKKTHLENEESWNSMEEAIQSRINQHSETSVESVWNEIKSCLIYAFEKNACAEGDLVENMSNLIKGYKKTLEKKRKNGCREIYLAAKRKAKSKVYHAEKAAQEHSQLGSSPLGLSSA